MKISTRLSITFSVIACLIFTAFGITVYWLASNHRRNEFRDRLKERVLVTEKIFLHKESFNDEEFEKINNQFLQRLHNETEEVVLITGSSTPQFTYNYPEGAIENLPKHDQFSFESEDVQGESRIFQVQGSQYLIIVTAIDKEGLENLGFLRNSIILLVLLSFPLITLVSSVTVRRALQPISKKIDKVNTISISNLHRRLNVYNPKDELGKMAIAFNKLLDRLETSFEAQKTFIRNASHEMRNPVTTIMGEAEISISKSRENEEYRESLAVILNEAERLNLTVNNLLQLSKVDAYAGQIQLEIVQFDEFMKEAKASFDFINSGNQIELKTETKSADGFKMMGNKNLLKTAIVNLFDNACKFSENKKVDVLVSKEEGQINVLIKDEGIGILEQDLESIINPFFRGNNALKIKGSGIGLPLSSKIIKLHGGTLKIESIIDQGTEVLISLPSLSA